MEDSSAVLNTFIRYAGITEEQLRSNHTIEQTVAQKIMKGTWRKNVSIPSSIEIYSLRVTHSNMFSLASEQHIIIWKLFISK